MTTWVISCALCHKPEADCCCEFDAVTQEQQRRLREGIVRLAAMPEDERSRLAAAALARVTVPGGVVTNDDFLPPSMTRWSLDIEAERMREGI